MIKPLVCALLLLCFTSRSHGQQSMVGERSCRTCHVELKAVATIGSAEGPGYLKDTFSGIYLDGKGRYWVFEERTPPRVFSHDGRYVKTIGRMGQGPGEFSGPWGIFDAGDDTVAVIDRDRITLVGPDLQIGRSTPSPVGEVWDGLTLSWPKNVVTNGRALEPGQSGRALHNISFESGTARSIRSFRAVESVPFTQQFAELRTYMTPAKKGGFWAVPAGRYEISRWSPDGRLLERIDRKPAWFAGPSGWHMGSAKAPPQPRINGVQEDANGLLWVYFSVGSPTYSRGWRAPAGAAEVAPKDMDYDLIFITRVEVIDPVAKSLIASTTFDRTIKAVLPGNRIVFFATLKDAPVAAVYEPRLIR